MLEFKNFKECYADDEMFDTIIIAKDKKETGFNKKLTAIDDVRTLDLTSNDRNITDACQQLYYEARCWALDQGLIELKPHYYRYITKEWEGDRKQDNILLDAIVVGEPEPEYIGSISYYDIHEATNDNSKGLGCPRSAGYVFLLTGKCKEEILNMGFDQYSKYNASWTIFHMYLSIKFDVDGVIHTNDSETEEKLITIFRPSLIKFSY